MNLLPEHEEDVKAAKIMKLSTIQTYEEKVEEQRKKYIGGVLIPNFDTSGKSSQTVYTTNADSLETSLSSDYSSAARESSVKKIQQIASQNVNKIRSTAFDLKVTKSRENKNVSDKNNGNILSKDFRIELSNDSSLNKSDNVINNNNQEINFIKIPNNLGAQNGLASCSDANLLDNKFVEKNVCNSNIEIKKNELDVLSNLYESSASSISDDDYL